MKADLLQFGSMLTWWWLPSLGSQVLLNVSYTLRILTPPPPGSAGQRNKHVQLARTIVILGTLVYQMVQAAMEAPPNYYELLALPLDVDVEGVRRSFRSVARKYHPDKVGEAGEALFIVARRAHDVLSDPNKRFGYDRFGDGVADWSECESQRDFLRRGLTGMVAFYTINPAMYAIFGYFNGAGASGVSFWRLASLLSMLALELCLLVSPDYPTWMSLLLPNTTIFDIRQLLRSLFVNFFFASIQLSAALDVLEYADSPPLRNSADRARTAEAHLTAIRARAQALDKISEALKTGMLQSLASELRPFRDRANEVDDDEKGEALSKMSRQEQVLFAKIDRVLLGRSLIEQHPQLMAMAHEDGQHVKVEEQAQAETDEPIKVKQEMSEPDSPETSIAPKAGPVHDTGGLVKAEVLEECLAGTAAVRMPDDAPGSERSEVDPTCARAQHVSDSAIEAKRCEQYAPDTSPTEAVTASAADATTATAAAAAASQSDAHSRYDGA